MKPLKDFLFDLKDFFSYSGSLFFGLWGAVGAVIVVLSVFTFVLSFWVKEIEFARWVAFATFQVAILLSGFRVWKAEANQRRSLENQIEVLKRPKFSSETKHLAEQRWSECESEEREAVRLLFREGDLSERQALDRLHGKGMALNRGSIYQGIAARTSFVQRVVPGRQSNEFFEPYAGPWTVNPTFKEVLKELLATDPGIK